MLIELLSKRNLTANYFAEKYDLSPRTVHRYLEVLSSAVPIQIKRGRNGGIYLSEHYKLPLGFFTTEEYDAIISALNASYAETLDERFLFAKRKLSTQEKHHEQTLVCTGESDDIIFSDTAFHSPISMLEKLRLLGACIRSRTIVDVEFLDNNKKTAHKIEPHVLLAQDHCWYVYAFCHTQRKFQFFSLGNITSLIKTEETFRKRPIETNALPSFAASTTITVRLQIADHALERAQCWLGEENIRFKNGKYIADVLFPDNEYLIKTLLSLGADFTVLSPKEIKAKLLTEAQNIANLYT